MAILNNDTDVSVLVDGLDHVEGIAWGLDGYCYAGGEAGQIYRVDVERKEVEIRSRTPAGSYSALPLMQTTTSTPATQATVAVMKITPDGVVTTYSAGAPDEPFSTPNYPAFDAAGNLYVCDSGDWKSDNGKIYRVKPGGETEVWTRTLCEFPNGLCMGPDGTSLFVAMSLNPPRVSEIQIAEDGSAGDVRTVVEVPTLCRTEWHSIRTATCTLPAIDRTESTVTALPASWKYLRTTSRARSSQRRRTSRSAGQSVTSC